MNIGRRELTENEFNVQWYKIYRELGSLYDTDACDAQVVYDALYVLCTSAANVDSKLYWKVGDFFYGKCEQIAGTIGGGSDHVAAYNRNFRKYRLFVGRADEMCCFLNDCVKGKSIEYFGFLLWEKCVIQGLGADFFERVYAYDERGGNERIEAVESLRCIVPADDEPLLYYTEKYEKIGLISITNKYKHIEKKTKLDEFAEAVWEAVSHEAGSFGLYFLEESAGRVEMALEQALFAWAGTGVVHAYASMLRKLSRGRRAESVEMGRTTAAACSNEMLSKLRFLIERTDQHDVLLRKHAWFFVGSRQIHLKLFEQLASLKAGHVAVKQAYAHFVYDAVQGNQEMLTGPVEQIYQLYDKLNIFEYERVRKAAASSDESLLLEHWHGRCTEMTAILEQILKRSLERVKPCYLGRLADYTNRIACAPQERRPYQNSTGADYAQFRALFALVSNKKEFANIYRETLSQRILAKNSLISHEIALLGEMRLEGQHRLREMVRDLSNETEHIRVLNNALWNFCCENPSLPLGDDLFGLIRSELPNFTRRSSGSRNAYAYDDPVTNETRSIQFAHQFSRIFVRINGRKFILSVYQYLIVRLVEDGLSGDEIQKTLGMNEKKIEILLKSLERSGVVSRRNGLFGYEVAAAAESTTSVGFALDSAQKGHIDIKNSRGFVDISNVDLDYFYNREHDTVSRLMAMVARVLKQKKKVEEDELRAHVTAMSGEMVDDELYQGVLKQAQERGLFEKHGTNYTYMT